MIKSTSVTQMEQFGRCELRWFFKSVLKKREPEFAFNELGTRTHKQIEHMARTGENVLNEIGRAGVQFIPAPSPELRIEWGLNDKPRPPPVNGKEIFWFPPEESRVRAAGVPLIGFMDLVDPRPYHIMSDGSVIDEPGIIEVNDWKTTSDFKWAKKADDLLHTAQMCGYGIFVVNQFPWVQSIRLSHTVFRTKDAAKAQKATTVVSVEAVKQEWSTKFEPLVQRMTSVATKREVEVEGNLEACEDYGGCPHRSYCHTHKNQTAISRMKTMGLLKKTAAAPVNGSPTNGQTPWISPTPPAGAVAAPPNQFLPQQPAQTYAPPPPPAPVVAAAAPPPAPAAPRAGLPPIQDVIEARAAIQNQRYIVRGAEAMYLCSTGGKQAFIPVVNGVIGGTPVHLDDAEQITLISAAPAATPAPVVAPPPPAPAPVAAAAPLPPPAPLAAAAVPPPLAPPATTEAPKRGRGRPPKAETAAKAAATATEASAAPAVSTFQLFINAIPQGPFTDLSGYVFEATRALEERFSISDIRSAPADHALGFTKWRGELASLVRAEPPEPGTYVAFTHGNELTQIVVEALSGICPPGFPVRGV